MAHALKFYWANERKSHRINNTIKTSIVGWGPWRIYTTIKNMEYLESTMETLILTFRFAGMACHQNPNKYYDFNTLRPRQYGRHFPDDSFKRICLNEDVSISLKISLKFVPKVQFNNIPALVQIMAWRRPGDKPLSEPMIVFSDAYMRHSASMS